MCWRGSNLVVALACALGCDGQTRREIDRLERCELTEQRLTSENAWPDPDEAPALAWNGEGYALAWMDYGHGLSVMDFSRAGTYFATVDEAGNIVQPEHRVLDEHAGIPAISWTGDGYALLSATEEIYFSRLDRGGAQLGESTVVADTPTSSLAEPRLVVTNEGFGAIWHQQPDATFRSHFARLGPSGEVLADTVISPGVIRSINARMVWTGDAFGLVWVDDRTGNLDVYFAELDREGNRRSPEIQVSNAATEASDPWLVWVGDAYGLAWSEYVSSNDNRGRDGP